MRSPTRGGAVKQVMSTSRRPRGLPERESIDLRRRGVSAAPHFRRARSGHRGARRVFKAVGLDYPETPARRWGRRRWALAKLRLRGLKFRRLPFDSIDQDELLKLDVGWSGGMSICLDRPGPCGSDFHCQPAPRPARGDLHRAARPLLAVASLFAVRGRRGLRRSGQLSRQAERWLDGDRRP